MVVLVGRCGEREGIIKGKIKIKKCKKNKTQKNEDQKKGGFSAGHGNEKNETSQEPRPQEGKLADPPQKKGNSQAATTKKTKENEKTKMGGKKQNKKYN